MGVVQHTYTANEPHNTWFKRWSEALRFSGSTSSMYAWRVKRRLLSLHVQTQSAYPICALSCPFPPLCKTGISKDKLVPKQSAAMGGALTCRHSVHTHKSRCHPGFLSNSNYARRSEAQQKCNAIYCAHRNICSTTTFMWRVFSQSGLQASLTTMSRLVKPTPVEKVKGEKKKGPGECPN